MILTV